MSTATVRITLDEYHEMAARGLLRPDAKDYLWHGEIVEVMTQDPPHAMVVQNLDDALRDLYPRAEWTVKEEKPLVLPDETEPLPDLMVLRGHKSVYRDRHPGPGDVELLVEVAHTSLRKDMVEKLPDYAAAGIPRYWIADIEGEAILAFWDPEPATGMYRASRVYTRGQAAETPNGVILVDEIFPQRAQG